MGTLALLLAAAAYHGPPPVGDLFAVRELDGTVTLHWTLPASPNVVGVTIDRIRIDDGHHQLTIFEIIGPTDTYHDTSAFAHRGYEYWVYTRDASGALSSGELVIVFSLDGDDHHSRHSFECHGAVSATAFGGRGAIAALLAVLLVGISRRRGTAR